MHTGWSSHSPNVTLRPRQKISSGETAMKMLSHSILALALSLACAAPTLAAPDAKLTVSFNPDEEVGSIGSGEIIAELADQHDVVLSCEPTTAAPAAKNDGLLLGASGTALGVMEVKGRASHAGAAPQLGRNALIE